MGKKHPLDLHQVFESSAKKRKSTTTNYHGHTEEVSDPSPENAHHGPQSGALPSPSSLATRFTQTAQLCSEIFDSPQLAAELTALAGQDITKTVLSIGQVLRSKQSIVPSTVSSSVRKQTSSGLPEVPTDVPHSENVTTALPELPSIGDPSLASMVFTHRSSADKEGRSDGKVSYERLEFLGDAYVELIASRLVYHKYPDLPPGRLSQIRESLVRNETLGSFALAYKFDDRIDLPVSYMEGRGAPRKLLVKTFGDVFEAYVAAVILCDQKNGFATAEAWLAHLWTPRLPGNEECEVPQNKFAKQDLSKKIMGKGVKVEYRVEEEQAVKKEGKIWYTVGAYVSGWGWEDRHLASGKGLSTGEAGIRAAMQALVNPLTAQIGAVKRDHDAKVKLEREQQAATTSSELG
ncbi:hypothetical protein MMC26_006898 [Xylographa opegraphella]|nr:hypothetical protein [Xylographa opegraphella]